MKKLTKITLKKARDIFPERVLSIQEMKDLKGGTDDPTTDQEHDWICRILIETYPWRTVRVRGTKEYAELSALNHIHELDHPKEVTFACEIDDMVPNPSVTRGFFSDL